MRDVPFELARLPRLVGNNSSTAADDELFSGKWSEGSLRCIEKGGGARVAPRISTTNISSKHHGVPLQRI